MTRSTASQRVMMGLGLALGLALTGAAAPDPARASDVQVASHVLGGNSGQWSGERRMSPGPYWRQPEPRGTWEHRGDRDDWRHHRQWHHGWHHHHGWGHAGTWWRAPIWVPGYWAWNGWGWVWFPGYWY